MSVETSTVEQQGPLIEREYVEKGSPDQLIAEALNGLGLNLQISKEDLLDENGKVRETGGVMISGTSDQFAAWYSLTTTPKAIAIRLAHAGDEIDGGRDGELSEARFDPQTKTQIQAYALHWQAIRQIRGALGGYVMAMLPWFKEMSMEDQRSFDPVAYDVQAMSGRDSLIQEAHQMTQSSREVLGNIKPLGRNKLIAIFQQEAVRLFPNLTANAQPQA